MISRVIRLLAGLLMAASLSGCLEYGTDEETASPTQAQVDRCRAEMYLRADLEMTPLGFKLEGSGIDDAIWFKFETPCEDLQAIFDGAVVDTSGFKTGFTFDHAMKDLVWWDVQGRQLVGAQVQLPNARFMNVGVERLERGHVVYIMWHEI